jgi:hypothetical protein
MHGEGSSRWWREGCSIGEAHQNEAQTSSSKSPRLGTDGREEDRAVQRIVCLVVVGYCEGL